MSERSGSLAAALVALQTRLPRITKDTQGQRSKYADLHGITDALADVLAELGLVWSCKPTLRDTGEFVLRYTITHAPSGEVDTGDYPLSLSDNPQTMGSQITYARRYALTAVLNIAPAEDDDDGQAAADASKGSQWMPPTNPRTRKATHHRNTAAEDTDWTTGPPEDAPGSITDNQTGRIIQLFGRLGITDRKDRLALCMAKLNLPELQSSKDLSMSQASLLIKILSDEERTQ